jgi:hypothetical protein
MWRICATFSLVRSDRLRAALYRHCFLARNGSAVEAAHSEHVINRVSVGLLEAERPVTRAPRPGTIALIRIPMNRLETKVTVCT